MAPAARRRRRLAPVYAQVAGALVAAVSVPTLALAGTATPVTAHPVTAAASPDATETPPPGDPTGGPTPIEPTATEPAVDPTPIEPPPTEPPATQSPTTEPPPSEPPVGSTPIGPQPTLSSQAPPAGPVPPLPTAPRPGQQAPAKLGQPRLGVFVSTSDVALTSSYWDRTATSVELRVTVQNTGEVAERVRLRYTLPPGITDTGTRGCYRVGNRSYECAAWTADAGARWSSRLKLRIAGDAWKAMPLSGSVQVTATAPGHPDAGQVSDDQGFAVLFPAGPPVAGMTLSATEVTFDLSGRPTSLQVRLGNTGKADATGSVAVILPPGVTVSTPPPGCRATSDGRTTCDVGRIRSGRSAVVWLPVSATATAQRMAPLAGAVVGMIKPRAGAMKRMQLSFRITAAAATSTPPPAVGTGVEGVAAGGPPAAVAETDVRQLALTLIGVSALLVGLALTLAVASLRRRMREEPVPPPAAQVE